MITIPASSLIRIRPGAPRLIPVLLLSCGLIAVPGAGPAEEPDADQQIISTPENPPEIQIPERKPEWMPERMEDLAAYLVAVRTHVEIDPSLASAYLVFWSELKSMAEQAADGVSDVENAQQRYASLVEIALKVSNEVKQHQDKENVKYLVSDVLQSTLRTLASNPGLATDRASDGKARSNEVARLLANLEPVLAPRLSTEGRYQFTGALRTAASIGSSAQVWNLCRAIPACVKAHDQLFAPAMSGISLIADVKKRLNGDLVLGESPLWQSMQPIAQSMDTDLSKVPMLEAREAVLKRASSEQWKAAMTDLPVAAGMKKVEANPEQPAPDGNRLDALFTLGLAGAQLAGSDQLARAFSITRTPALEFASLASQGALAGSFATSMAGVALLVAGVQALTLLDGNDADAQAASVELRELMTALDARTHAAIADARAEQLLALNTVDTRVAALGLALDVVKTDVARLESASRRRIAAAFETDAARRWSDFDAANGRCFSLRHRNPMTNRLPPAEFRRCEDLFLQGATIKARYSNRSTEYAMDARFIDAAEVNFPFHQHYPLLFTQSGLDSRRALALSDPVEWQQYVAALLRLYQEHPASQGERARRHETLEALSQAGERTREALQELVVQTGGSGKPVFRQSLHEQVIERYLQSLQKLSERVIKLDDPAAHPFGKRMTLGLDERLPSGSKHSIIEAELSRSVFKSGGLPVCPDAGPDNFLPQQERVVAETRRFFGSPITPEELATAWNREMVDDLRLQLDGLSSIIPEPFLWASLDGLGTLRICLARFRPETASFTREDGPVRDTLRGMVIVGADIEVRFAARESTASAMGLVPGEALLLARHSGGRACTFGYRNDDEGCSRARCLREIAPSLWGTDKRLTAKHVSCEEGPLRTRLAASQATEEGADLDAVLARLEPLYWQRQAERLALIEADALRSDEFEAVSTQFLQYYALAGTTLGAYPETAILLQDLFGEDSALTPRKALQGFISTRKPFTEQVNTLREKARGVLALVNRRGEEIQDPGMLERLPHLAMLDDMVARIELAGSAYVAD